MDNRTLLKILSGVLMTIMLILCPQLSFAEKADPICAAVFPCDGSGQILPEFRGGACEPVYAAVCAQEALNKRNEELYTCGSDMERLQKKVRRLRKQMRANRSRRAH